MQLRSKPHSCSCLSFLVQSWSHLISPSFFCSLRPFQYSYQTLQLYLLQLSCWELVQRPFLFWPWPILTLSHRFSSPILMFSLINSGPSNPPSIKPFQAYLVFIVITYKIKRLITNKFLTHIIIINMYVV